MPCGVGNRKLDMLRSSDHTSKRITSLQPGTYCKVATNVLLALLYSHEGHLCCNVRWYVINNTVIRTGQNWIKELE